MKEIFTYMFNQDNWVKKISFFYGIIFVTTVILNFAAMYSPNNMLGELTFLFFVFLFSGILALFLPCGYSVLNIKNHIDKKDGLPDFDFNKIFITGFKFSVAFLIFASIIAVIFYILGSLNILFAHKHLSALSFLVATTSFLITFIVLFLLNASVYRFAKTNDILAFIKISDLNSMINKNVNKYFLSFILSTVILVTVFLAKYFMAMYLIFYGIFGLVIYSLILSIVLTYLILVYTKVIANSLEE